ncbi:MAG: hypothetical protein PVJ67_01555 [Candidatus Pacearchaeota archaeon]|jgi:hypothetical protein
MSQKNYQELQIDSNLKLGGLPLDFEKFYDIKTPEGKIFIRGNIYSEEYLNRYGRWREAIHFFRSSDGLDIRLQSGLLMRVNQKMTNQREEERRLSELARLHKQRKEIRKKIGSLANDLGMFKDF